jgi:hydrogenase expression/formation protein HypC
VPAKIISLDNILATVDIMGARRDVSIILVTEDVVVGDYVLVHAGFALKKIDEEAAQESIRLIREYEALMHEAEVSEMHTYTCDPAGQPKNLFQQ